MAIAYPAAAATRQQKHDFLYYLMDGEFRLLKNFMRRWHRFGITRDQYDNGVPAEDLKGPVDRTFVLPPGYKSRIAYVEKLPRGVLDAVFENDLDVTERDILDDLSAMREAQMTSSQWAPFVDLDNVRT